VYARNAPLSFSIFSRGIFGQLRSFTVFDTKEVLFPLIQVGSGFYCLRILSFLLFVQDQTSIFPISYTRMLPFT
jgi:hypothetical protein